MKRLFIIMLFLTMLLAPAVQAAVVSTPSLVFNGQYFKVVKIACVGTSDGAATDALTISAATYPEIYNAIQEYWVYLTTIIPGTGTAPDSGTLSFKLTFGSAAGTVDIYKTNGVDLLHATDTLTRPPDITYSSSTNAFWPVIGAPIIDTEGQATGGGTWDIYIIFMNPK